VAFKVVNTVISGGLERCIFAISGHGCRFWTVKLVVTIETVGYMATGNVDQNWRRQSTGETARRDVGDC
jgi:hypothetical protein